MLDFNSQPHRGFDLQPPPAPRARRRPWLQLVPPPPGVTFADLAVIHCEQLHRAVAKAIGKRGGDFAAAINIDLGLDPSFQSPRPHLVVASTRFRRDRWDDQIDIAAHPCTDAVAAYYATPVPQEAARWAFDHHGRASAYKVVVRPWGTVEQHANWGTTERYREWVAR